MPANIDYAKCDNCGACYTNCPLDVFERDDDLGIYRVTFTEDCWHCGVCVLDCPREAIELTVPFGCM
jgi:NAD-dependent dihydropyrimidine dehydrogenase PreA subunit